jgi:hypothetical protein
MRLLPYNTTFAMLYIFAMTGTESRDVHLDQRKRNDGYADCVLACRQTPDSSCPMESYPLVIGDTNVKVTADGNGKNWEPALWSHPSVRFRGGVTREGVLELAVDGKETDGMLYYIGLKRLGATQWYYIKGLDHCKSWRSFFQDFDTLSSVQVRVQPLSHH